MAFSACGVDFGNCYCVCATVSGDRVDVVSNQCSNRLTPSAVVITPTRRYAGEAAQQQRMRHPDVTFSRLKELVGLRYRTPERERLQLVLPYKLVELGNSYTGVVVTYQGEQVKLSPEQLIACLFRDLDHIVKAHVPKLEQYVLAVPSWWGERERRAILQSVRLADMQCMSLINATTAAALAYEFDVRSQLATDRFNYVLFIDVGNSAMSVSLVRMKPKVVEALVCDYTMEVSGSYFTFLLTDYVLKIIERQYHISRRDLSPRALLKLDDAVEKAKRNLAVNTTVQFECDSLAGGVSVQFRLKREEFLNLVDPIIERGMKVIENVLQAGKIRKEYLFSVQLLGGCSRVFSLDQKVRSYFGGIVGAHVNKDECFAVGCARFASTLNSKSKSDMVIHDVLTHDILIQCGERDPYVLFAKGTPLPAIKKETLPVQRTLTITATSCGDWIAECQVQASRSAKVQFSVNSSMLFHAVALEPAKSTFRSLLAPNDFELSSRIELELGMMARDEEAVRVETMKNEIEGMFYELQGLTQRGFPAGFPENAKRQALEIVPQIERMLEDDDTIWTLKDCEEKHRILMGILHPGTK